MSLAAWIEFVCELLGGIVALALILRPFVRWGRKVATLLFSIDDRMKRSDHRLSRLERHDLENRRQLAELQRRSG